MDGKIYKKECMRQKEKKQEEKDRREYKGEQES